MGGFGFTQRQLSKHEALYNKHGFDVLPVLSTIPQLVMPRYFTDKRGPELAAQIQDRDQDTVIHVVSGSFWTMIATLAAMDPDWRERRLRAIMFDSAPPRADVYAFGGWASWYLNLKTGLPTRLTKPLVSHLFHPVFWSLPSGWMEHNHRLMFDDKLCVVPRRAACLFIRGRGDPVLNPDYMDAFAAFLESRSIACVERALFQKSKHAMAVVDDPAEYKRVHVGRLLARVHEWRKEPAG